MGFKIAIATTDGKTVNEHFGKAQQFSIVEAADDGSFTFIENRSVTAACGGSSHDEGALAVTAKSLGDCEYVLVARIGPGAERVLSEAGITAFSISVLIDEAVHKLVAYRNRSGKNDRNKEL